MGQLKVSDNAATILAAALTNNPTETSMTLVDASRFPVINHGGVGSDWSYATLFDAANNLEIVKVTRRDNLGNVLTIVRGSAAGIGGVTDANCRSWASTSTGVACRLIAKVVNDISGQASAAAASASAAATSASAAATSASAAATSASAAATSASAAASDAATALTNAVNAATVEARSLGSATAAAGGTANAVTGSFAPAVTTLDNGMLLHVRAAAKNTGPVTFTPNSGSIPAKAVVRGDGLALAEEDIPGAGAWIDLRYDSILDKWVFANHELSISTAADVQDFRLSLSSSAPVSAGDVVSSTLYCVEKTGNKISLYNGSRWVMRASSTFSKALSGLTANLPYDVFCYDNGGVPTLEFTAWAHTLSRNTALARQDGILVKAGDATRRYLGSFLATAANQTEDSKTKRFLWNYYHRAQRRLLKTIASASWTYTTAAWRQAEGSVNNQVSVFVGLVEDAVSIEAKAVSTNSVGSCPAMISIGVNDTTGPYMDTLNASSTANAASVAQTHEASLRLEPGIGLITFSMLEYSGALGVTTWVGSSSTRQSGLSGVCRA